MALIKTAFFSHKSCLLCRCNKKLHEVKDESINYANRHFKIFIKKGACICQLRLDSNKQILINEDQKIPTRLKTLNTQIFQMFNSLSSLDSCINVFDKFKNMESLEEDHCFKITKMKKFKFILFSKYITSLKKFSK